MRERVRERQEDRELRPGWVRGLGLAVSAAALLALSVPAHAQVQRLPGVIDRELPEPPPIPETLPPVVDEPGPKLKEPSDPGASVPTVTAVTFEGNTVFDEGTLQAVASPFLNRPLTRADIAQLKFDLSKLYYDDGYILARVVTPPQDLSDGVLDVVIYEARIGKVIVEENEVLSDTISGAMASQVAPGDIFHEEDVESMVRDIDDLSGLGASLNVHPGGEIGTTDLDVIVREENDFTQRMSVDNYGSPLTGEVVGQANLQYGNLLGLGEKYFVNFAHAYDDLVTVEGGLVTPIGVSNLLFDVSGLYSNNDIGGDLAPLGASGETYRVRTGISSALINTGREKMVVRAGFEARTNKSDLMGVPETDDDIRQLHFQGSYLRRWPGTVFYMANSFVKGVNVLNGSEPSNPLTSRAGGDPEAFIIRPIIYLQSQPWTDGELTVVGTGQWTPDTLLASDLFIIGGYGSVRGFDPAQESGDIGGQGSVEYQHMVYDGTDFDIKVGPWGDVAGVIAYLPGTIQDDILASVGMGAELIVDLGQYGTTTFRFDWAHPVGPYNSPDVSDDTFYGRMVHQF